MCNKNIQSERGRFSLSIQPELAVQELAMLESSATVRMARGLLNTILHICFSGDLLLTRAQQNMWSLRCRWRKEWYTKIAATGQLPAIQSRRDGISHKYTFSIQKPPAVKNVVPKVLSPRQMVHQYLGGSAFHGLSGARWQGTLLQVEARPCRPYCE